MPRKKISVKKNFVLDTNILLHDKYAIYGFDDNNVYITGTTLQELDAKKTAPGELGYTARETCRVLDHLRQQGDLIKGVDLYNLAGNATGGKLYIEPDGIDKDFLPRGYSLDVADNRIISTCLYLSRAHGKDHEIAGLENLILVTNDISMRINATIMGLSVEGYRNDHITEDSLYSGRREIASLKVKEIDALKTSGTLEIKENDARFSDICENEFLVIFDPSKTKTEEYTATNSILAIYSQHKIRHITPQSPVYGVKARNAAQEFALYALTAPVDEIPLVFLIGPAGTSKTFLSLAVGLDGVNDYKYNKILLSRNNVTSDEAFGYLPGTLEEKMMPLLAPFYDNLETIIRGNGETQEQIQIQIDDLFSTGTLQVAPMAYMRGRSITNSYVILDEAQNATQSQIRDVITRAGAGTKIVICGDTNQIDAPTLDKMNNGLTYASTKMKSSSLAATIVFNAADCQRSALAADAINLM